MASGEDWVPFAVVPVDAVVVTGAVTGVVVAGVVVVMAFDP
jgi:hypothetical protein